MKSRRPWVVNLCCVLVGAVLTVAVVCVGPVSRVSAGPMPAAPRASTTQTLTTADSQVTPGINNQGWWTPDSSNPNDNSNDNYFVGTCGDSCNGPGSRHRNFFTFDVSSLTGTVVSATLKLQRFYGHGDPTERFGLFGVATPSVTLNQNNGTSQAIYDDLGSGPSFGAFDVSTSGSPNDVVSFALNARGIQGLENQRAGLGVFAIGGSLLSEDSGDDFLFGWSGAAAQSLEVVTTTAPPADKANPAAAWNGSNSLVVWQDSRNGDDDIYGARVSPSGVVLDPGGFPISRAVGDQQFPAVAWNGSTFFVTWQDRRSGRDFDIYGTRVSSTKVVSNPAGIRLSSALRDQTVPTVAANGATFLIVWQDGRNNSQGQPDNTDIYGGRVSGAGAVLNPGGFPISRAGRRQLRPNVASNGTNWLVAWTDRRPGGQSDIYSTRVGASGNVVNPSGIALSIAPLDQSEPQIAWNGSVFLVVWSDFRSNSTLDIYGTRVSSSGSALNPSGIAISAGSGQQSSAAVTSIGSQFLASWHDSRNGTLDILAGRVSSAGGVLDGRGFVVSNAANDQSTPTLARNGPSNYLAAWADLRSPAVSRIFGTRITTAGAVLTPSGTNISG